MDLKVLKIVNENKMYKSSKGKEYPTTNYYLVVNGNYICIRPSFAKDYSKLDLFADVIRNGSK